ncbi:hypothetical protein E4U19_007153 [Claviceps sp. Clav32 group G5]|nr:hypothetical protein E4U19_007153 [Claviceps sp. Clav32 group G5]
MTTQHHASTKLSGALSRGLFFQCHDDLSLRPLFRSAVATEEENHGHVDGTCRIRPAVPAHEVTVFTRRPSSDFLATVNRLVLTTPSQEELHCTYTTVTLGGDSKNLYNAESFFHKRHDVEAIVPYCEPLERNSSIVDQLKYLATFPKAQQLDSDLALDELSHVDAVLVTRIAEKGIDIEHTLTYGSSPLPEDGQLGFVSNSTLPVMGSG